MTESTGGFSRTLDSSFGRERARGEPWVLRTILLLFLLAGTVAIFSAAMPQFMTSANGVNLLRQASVLAIVSSGMTFVIVSGEIDLSVGSLVALVAVLVAWMADQGAPLVMIVLGAAVAGIMAGILNSTLTLVLGVPSFLATLGTLAVFRGLALTLSLQPIPLRNINMIKFFRWSPLSVPVPIAVAALVVLTMAIVYKYTAFGLRTRAVGSKEVSARLSGLATSQHKFAVFLLCSFLAAVAGVVLAGRTNYGMAQAGTGLELDAIAAVLLGGGRLGGGVGSILGSLVAALVLTVIFTGIATLGLAASFQDVAKGGLVAMAIVLMQAPTWKLSWPRFRN